MKLSLKPLEIPFRVGDTVWFSQAGGNANQRAHCQAKIIQIILDGSLTNSIVIRQRQDIHEVAISSAIYDLKPSGDHSGSPRLSIDVSLLPRQKDLFGTEQELADYETQTK